MDKDRVLKTLLALEWSGVYDWSTGSYCTICDQDKKDGHKENCELGSLIPLMADGEIPLDRMRAHVENWVYREARSFTEEVRREQIIKGAEKYETPLGDAEWTPQQLVHHAMQENIDQNHYLTMLQYEIKKMNGIIERQAVEILRLERLLNP